MSVVGRYTFMCLCLCLCVSRRANRRVPTWCLRAISSPWPQTILAMIIKNLPKEEVRAVMGHMRHAVKDTYFEKWLASGGFQWPSNLAPTNKVRAVFCHACEIALHRYHFFIFIFLKIK